MSADFSQRSVVQVNKTANDVIDTFGNADFGNYDSESMCGFAESDSIMPRLSQYYKRDCECHTDREHTFDDEYSEESSEEPVNITQDTPTIVKETATAAVEQKLLSEGASSQKIAEVKSAIQNIKNEKIEQAVADTLAAKKNVFIHPMMKLQSAKLSGGFSGGMGDWFSDLRDTVVQSTATQAEKSAQQLATSAVQAVVAPVAQALTKAASTPQAQAALQQATNTGIQQFQTALTAKAKSLWTEYRLPIIAGAAGLTALTLFLIIRKRK